MPLDAGHPVLSNFRKHLKRLSLPIFKDKDRAFTDDSFRLPSPNPSPTTEEADFFALSSASIDADEGTKQELARLIAEYGSSSATSWLEFSRYKLWRAPKDIPSSSFRPVQGYLRADTYVFAWGNPLVSDPAALEDTCYAFWRWCKKQNLKLIWCCVDGEMERVLGKNSRFGWSTLSCIVEDVLDPVAVVELAQSSGGGEEVKDFKKNIRRAERAGVAVREVQREAWTQVQKKEVEEGIANWKKAKAKGGLQIASSSFQPWIDAEHRRYWIAEHQGHVAGILILSRIHHDQYQIKNAASFPNSPRGTSEYLIYQSMKALDAESDSIEGSTEREGTFLWERGEPSRSDENPAPGSLSPSDKPLSPRSSMASRPMSASATEPGSSGSHLRRTSVTFGITASESITPGDNLKGWKITWLTTTYNKIVGSTGITRRGDFRNKFHTTHMPMYVCFPAKQGFGIDGVTKLIKSLRQ